MTRMSMQAACAAACQERGWSQAALLREVRRTVEVSKSEFNRQMREGARLAPAVLQALIDVLFDGDLPPWVHHAVILPLLAPGPPMMSSAGARVPRAPVEPTAPVELVIDTVRLSLERPIDVAGMSGKPLLSSARIGYGSGLKLRSGARVWAGPYFKNVPAAAVEFEPHRTRQVEDIGPILVGQPSLVVARVDVAVDYALPLANLWCADRRTRNQEVRNNGRESIAFGARGGPRFVRVYEREVNDVLGTRVEVEIRPKVRFEIGDIYDQLLELRPMNGLTVASLAGLDQEDVIRLQMAQRTDGRMMRHWTTQDRQRLRQAEERAQNTPRIVQPAECFESRWVYAVEAMRLRWAFAMRQALGGAA